MTWDQPTPAGFGLEAEGEHLRPLCFSHEAMHSVFEIRCVHEDRTYAAQAAEEAFRLLDRLEQEQSRFIANSDVSRINALAAGESARVCEATLECLVIAHHLYELTAGAFDASVGSGWERLELNPGDGSVRAREAGARLDLGGIGKGFAVDRMAELLLEWDLPKSLVHGGFSSVRVLDAPPGLEGWPLRLTAPGRDAPLARLEVRWRAFGASGLEKGAHIVDPRTGEPVRRRQAAWVALSPPPEAAPGLSPAAVADALSTAVMVLPDPDVARLRDLHPELEVWSLRRKTRAPSGRTPPP